MKTLSIYYYFKPLIPRRLQIGVRRLVASYKRLANFDNWPIDQEAATPPVGWTKWPKNKKFALALTHDVDSLKGYDNCLKLMEFEKKLNFRSSFNFVPEGYPISEDVRQAIKNNGFDVGVHGLTHEGRHFLSRDKFIKCVPKINSYLKEWRAVGFHSPSMLVHLNWITELEVGYDCSTFDTDPFEPINYGVKTIYPFIVSDVQKKHSFVEIPYTLPQDHTLFIILREKNNSIWKKKLDWIAANGGMVFLNTHPDYMNFSNSACLSGEYPFEYYLDFLDFIKTRYSGQFWHALPREIASYWQDNISSHLRTGIDLPLKKGQNSTKKDKGKIWIDLDNSPHVLFFRPMIRELEKRGYRVLLTARDNSQTCELADRYLINYLRIGKHYGRNPLVKVIATIIRALILAFTMRKHRPKLAMGHGSRAQVLAARLLGVYSLGISDYEYTAGLGGPNWVMSPEVLVSSLSMDKKKQRLSYPGIKEDVYLPFFKPDPSLKTYLGIREEEILVTIRPPATEAHYHNPESELLFVTALNRIKQMDSVRMVILPRYESQLRYITKNWQTEIKSGKIIIPEEALDGPNLLWNSDLVISGGGTMNREAAALHVPVYSIFRGKIGAVDHWLHEQGRLELIESVEDIYDKIEVKKREIKPLVEASASPALSVIIKNIENLIATVESGK